MFYGRNLAQPRVSIVLATLNEARNTAGRETLPAVTGTVTKPSRVRPSRTRSRAL
jgi:hypothetical protein